MLIFLAGFITCAALVIIIPLILAHAMKDDFERINAELDRQRDWP